jgi:hypothetical protein
MERTKAKIYLAARFARRDEMRTIAAELRDEGFDITARWLDSTEPITSGELRSPVAAAHLATNDVDDVCAANICIAFTEELHHPSPGRGGRHTEFGIALASGAHMVVVGPREHIFHCLPQVSQFDDWTDARRHLAGWARAPATNTDAELGVPA